MKKKVCIVTAARSEYGLLRWVIDEVYRDNDFEFQLVVTGAHLSEDQGLTYKQIEADGYPIAAKVDMRLNSVSKASIVESMGYCSIGFSHTLNELKPDIIVVLGDRYELLPICSAALVMNIPVAHISGGDVTIGAIDNEVRNSVTMMSELHFPGVVESADNIVRMRGSDKNVWIVGEPGLESFHRLPLMNRSELSSSLHIPLSNRWILVTIHPETQESLEYNLKMAENIVSLMNKIKDVSVVISYANADFGGTQINDFWKSIAQKAPEKYSVYPSLGQVRYLSFMKECFAVVGNSSSGIVEAPHLGTPVINIGNRQTGRHLCKNVIQVNNEISCLTEAWEKIEKNHVRLTDDYYGNGFTSKEIVKHIREFLYGV
ncbi:MAG: UDP-N-acetylglucosamine 2-epimerase (hydrolyzing) [Fibrobacter sp.]|nr:UDP-N-acetylglucosamine 2-epimerase (hydrolyzing) [Fibrobacter sp.]